MSHDSALQPRSQPYPNMGGHGGHTHNHRPPTIHSSSCWGLVSVAIALRLRVGMCAKRPDVGRRSLRQNKLEVISCRVGQEF
eukprot:scaffold67073_cov38-Attheya_sp.AAC.4